MILFEMIR